MNLIISSINSSIPENNYNKKQFYTGYVGQESPAKIPVSFKSIPIYEINIKDAAGKPVRAVITKFDPADAADKEILKLLKELWNKNFPDPINLCADFINDINHSFVTSKETEQYWAIELANSEKNNVDNILGFVQFDKQLYDKDNIKINISRITTRDDISHKNPDRTLKYVANSIFYALTNYFKSSNVDIIKLASANDAYYDRINMPKMYSGAVDRIISKKNANKFMRNLRGKDCFDFEIKSCHSEYEICKDNKTFFSGLRNLFKKN